MENNSVVKMDSEIIDTKIQKWMKNNCQEIDNIEIYKNELESLLAGYRTDLGGLVAIRGFIYQYYVAIFYMLKMLHENNSWWDKVVFELMDDVALVGREKVRFIQVKTVKETGEGSNLTPTILCKRENGELKSWLDKLFMNYKKFNESKKIDFNFNDNSIIEFQFEIATNNTYNGDLEIYSNNFLFFIEEKEKSKEENLFGKIPDYLKIPCKETNDTLEVLTNQSVEWFLSRFRLNHLNQFVSLKSEIVSMIKEITKVDSTDVSEQILTQIFYFVLERTHNDQVTNINSYIFTKEEFERKINDVVPSAVTNVRSYLYSKDIGIPFLKCIEELRADFQNIASPVRVDLNQTLTWIQKEFFEKSKDDQFIYTRFLHLLFDLHNAETERGIKNSDEVTALKRALELLTFCLTFYMDKQFLLTNASMVAGDVTHGTKEAAERRIFTFFHAGNKGYYDVMCKKIGSTIENCFVLQNIHERFFCIVIGAKQRGRFNRSVKSSGINQNFQIDNESSIVDKPNLIKYYDDDFLQEVKDYFIELEEEVSLSNMEPLSAWHNFLEETFDQ